MGNPFENLTGLVNCQVMVKCRGLSIQLVNGGGPCLEGLCGLWVDLHMCIHAWLYTHTHIYQNKSSRKSAASNQWMGQMWRISLKGYCFEDWLRNNFPGKTSLLAKYHLSRSEWYDLLEREMVEICKAYLETEFSEPGIMILYAFSPSSSFSCNSFSSFCFTCIYCFLCAELCTHRLTQWNLTAVAWDRFSDLPSEW